MLIIAVLIFHHNVPFWANRKLARLRRGITPEINAISTIIFAFSLIAIVVWYRLRVRAEGGAEIGAELLETAETPP